MEVVVSQRSSGDGDVLLFAPKLDVGMYPRREQFPPTWLCFADGGSEEDAHYCQQADGDCLSRRIGCS